MAAPIQPNQNTPFTAHHSPRTQQPNFQQAVQRLGETSPGQSQNPLAQFQGQSQDSMVNFSPEAMESLAQSQVQSQSQGQSGPSPDQLEQQIQSGDLQGALSTISQLDAAHPSQGNDPNQKLKSDLKNKLQQGDQAGAEAALEQIKANRPPGPPPQQ